ncbi:MAG: hypothetical protein ACTSW3_10905 [Promethearchaeota archaeon]
MQIHSLFILRKTGECIYSRNFTKIFDKINPNLITPFFSAIFSFSESVILKKTPEILEMGGFRFVFEIFGNHIISILADSSTSLLFIKTRINEIMNEFGKFMVEKSVEEDEQILNPSFDRKIDLIISGDQEIASEMVLYKKIIDFLKKMLMGNEISGAALLLINGRVIYSSLPQDILLSSLKELEIRHMIANEFDMTFYRLENQQKIFSKIVKIPWKLDPLLIVVLFDASVPLGMAEINMDKIAKTIENII